LQRVDQWDNRKEERIKNIQNKTKARIFKNKLYKQKKSLTMRIPKRKQCTRILMDKGCTSIPAK
jgi:predicted DNA binding CopG/RHH family protein